MIIERYVHHGIDVAVFTDLKGKHREHCLCYAGCVRFKPGQPDNCEIAQEVYNTCLARGVVTPVWECPEYRTQ